MGTAPAASLMSLLMSLLLDIVLTHSCVLQNRKLTKLLLQWCSHKLMIIYLMISCIYIDLKAVGVYIFKDYFCILVL